MNTERDNGQRDPLVSATYRELASERAPAHLDDKVLLRAARGRRTRYSLAYAWMRPVAWAATIGLCLALVLELSRVPDAPDAVYIPGTPAPTSLESEPALDLDEAVERKREMMAPAAGKTRQKPLTMDATRTHDADSMPEELVAPDANLQREAGEQADARGVPPGDTALNESAPDGALRRDPQITGAASQAAAGVVADDEAPVCPAQSRATAEDWFACIAELKASGDEELADREFTLFIAAYPDFEAPAPK